MMMESWRKIGWGLLAKDDEVNELRWQLSHHIGTIQAVMLFAQWYAVELLHPFRLSLTAYYLCFSVVTEELWQQNRRTLVKCLTRHLPISIGYTWEGGATADTVAHTEIGCSELTYRRLKVGASTWIPGNATFFADSEDR